MIFCQGLIILKTTIQFFGVEKDVSVEFNVRLL